MDRFGPISKNRRFAKEGRAIPLGWSGWSCGRSLSFRWQSITLQQVIKSAELMEYMLCEIQECLEANAVTMQNGAGVIGGFPIARVVVVIQEGRHRYIPVVAGTLLQPGIRCMPV